MAVFGRLFEKGVCVVWWKGPCAERQNNHWFHFALVALSFWLFLFSSFICQMNALFGGSCNLPQAKSSTLSKTT
jgi:hypothetical protein